MCVARLPTSVYSGETDQTVSPVVREETLPQLFERVAADAPDRVAQQYKGGVYDRSLVDAGVVDPAPDGAYASLSYADLRRVVRRLAAGFRALGLKPGGRVAIVAETRMEWAHVDFATLAAGGVVTAAYPGSSPDRLNALLADASPTLVVVGGTAEVNALETLGDDVVITGESGPTAVVTMDEVAETGPLGARSDAAADGDADPGVNVCTLGDVYERGERRFDADRYRAGVEAVAPDDLASLVYTSGTTGRPKGVRLTHAAFRANVAQCLDRLGGDADDGPGLNADSTALSVLPLTHVFERTMGHYLMFGAGGTVAYAEGPKTLPADLSRVQPTMASGVPRIYEKLFAGVVDPDAEAATAPVFGGNIDWLVSGGGALSPSLCAAFHDVGLPILEGYGLTETAPVVSVNSPTDPAVGTIGPPVADTQVAIDERVGDGVEACTRHSDDEPVGELLVRGPQVTDGYWNRPNATREAFSPPASLPDLVTAGPSPATWGGDPDEPWFHTGDVVRLRADGHLVFQERKKRLLVLSTGENVAPRRIETRLADDPLVDQCVVLGDDRRFVSALVVADLDAATRWATDAGVDLPTDRPAASRDPRLRERLAAAVETANDDLEPVERVKRFRVLPTRLTPENGLLTPTLKQKREAICGRFDDTIESMYEPSTHD
jgi:long-chain acyl-CoA synthetase